jgi:hypothetical protein
MNNDVKNLLHDERHQQYLPIKKRKNNEEDADTPSDKDKEKKSDTYTHEEASSPVEYSKNPAVKRLLLKEGYASKNKGPPSS